MSPPPSARGDAPTTDDPPATDSDAGSTGPTLLVAVAAVACGSLVAWLLSDALAGSGGFSAVETALVAGVVSFASYACFGYVAARASTD